MTSPIRLIVQQPSLAKYRVPVFRELAKFPDIDLQVLYGVRRDIPNVDPDGFHAEPVYLWQQKFRDQHIFWHSAQWKSASRKKADVLSLSWNPRYASLVPTLLKAKAAGVSTILWGHGYSKSENSIRRKVRDSVAQLATALMFYNQTAANSYLDAGWDPEAIFIARNSLDQGPIKSAKQLWLSDAEKLNAFRLENNFGPGPHVLFVSRLDATNRLDLLVEAIVLLQGEFPHIQVNIVGKGPAEQARIESLATTRGVSSHFRFIGAIYDEEVIAPWFLASDVFCYPANIGLSILHAFGYGLPVVTSDDLGAQNPEIEALQTGQNGLLYRHDDPAALATALRTVFKDKVLALQMSQNSVRTVEGEFSLSGMVNEMAKAVRYCASKCR